MTPRVPSVRPPPGGKVPQKPLPAPAGEDRSASFAIGPVICWKEVATTVRVLAATAGPVGLASLERLVLGLTDPLRRIDALANLAQRAVDGDDHAANELRSSLAAIIELAPATRGLANLFIGAESAKQADAGCDSRAERAHLAAGQTVVRSSDQGDIAADPGVLDEGALVTLTLAITRIHAAEPPRVRADALDAVVALLLAADTFISLTSASRAGGPEALRDHIEQLSASGRLAGLIGGGMQFRSGQGGAGFSGFDFPDFPDFPDIPVPKIPGLKAVDELLGRIKGRKHWDPDVRDRVYPQLWREPVQSFPKGWPDHLACVREVFSRIIARAGIPPPARPTRVTWTTGITSIVTSGACTGDSLVIHGEGFAALRSSALLLLPFTDGCHPVTVPAVDWTDTSITVTLPAGGVSGPIGFGDAAYIAAYDAWASEQNRLADEIRQFKCGRLVGKIELVKPFGECPPDIGINHLRAGVAIIDAFTASGQPTTVVEPGESVLLAWTIRNAEHIRLDRVSSDGPIFGSSAALIDPVGSSRLIGPFAHTSPINCTYRLTATGPCGSVTRDITIAASKRPSLSISAIEVTQGIQTLSSTVRLVERKPTVVRVTVRHGLSRFGNNAVPNVQGRIRVRRNDGVRSAWFDAANNSLPMAPTPGASITVVADPQRNNTNDTLNFIVPPMWCIQSVAYEIEVRTSGFGAVPGFAGFEGFDADTSGLFSFEPRRTLELRYIRVNWGGSTPSDQICLDTLRGAIPLLPTPTANISALAGVGVQNPSGAGDVDRNNLLDAFDDQHSCSAWEELTEWLGSECPDDDGAIWVLIPGIFYRGQAYGNVCFTPPTGPVGGPIINRGPYAAHELSHCLNQTHVRRCGNPLPEGGDAPSDWPNNAQLVDVPFDSMRNKALSLAGTGVFDIMTYCGDPDNTWPMPRRWDQLWTEIGS